jgi:hypothetical protein
MCVECLLQELLHVLERVLQVLVRTHSLASRGVRLVALGSYSITRPDLRHLTTQPGLTQRAAGIHGQDDSFADARLGGSREHAQLVTETAAGERC